MQVYTAQQIREIEQHAVSCGMDYLRLMENAGSACARIIRETYHLEERPGKLITVVCGKGKNGGDGFVIARKLNEIGARVTVILACGEPVAPDAIEMFARLENQSAAVIRYDPDFYLAQENISKADLLIDAVFGIGFSGLPQPRMAELFQWISRASGEKVAIDVPSGVDCDTGSVAGICVHADRTIAITALKPAHVIDPAMAQCGQVVTASIGIPTKSIESVKSDFYTVGDEEVRDILPRRPAQSNKGDYGHLLSICGSRNMPGAAVFAARSAVRMGVGLVTAAFPQSAYPAIAPQLTEPLLLPLPDLQDGTFSMQALALIRDAMKKATAILLGCGIGQTAETRAIAELVLREAACPVVLDADGINVLAGHIDIWKAAKAPIVLTPHPGEMARLVSSTAAQVQQYRLQMARTFSAANGVTLVLKGAGTLIASRKGRLCINRSGNAGMAKGGSGDVLAGMLGSLLAQGMGAEDAAVACVYLHGLAGDAALHRLSQRGMTPSDLIQELPVLLSHFE